MGAFQTSLIPSLTIGKPFLAKPVFIVCVVNFSIFYIVKEEYSLKA
jgi:hypothetical protein